MTPRETRLRSLCFWYELNGQAAVAGALQDAADAVRGGALGDGAADALIDVWRPFVRVEATAEAPSPTLDAVRFAVEDLRRMLREADNEIKPMIADKLRKQVAILRKLEGSTT